MRQLKYIKTILIYSIIGVFLLVNNLNGETDKAIGLIDRTTLYEILSQGASAPQSVVVKERNGDCFKMQSYLGDRYFYRGQILSPVIKEITTLNSEYLYENKNAKSKIVNTVGEQKLKVVAEEKGFFKVITWLDEYYIYPQKYIDSNGEKKYRLDKKYHLYTGRAYSKRTKDSVSNQAVTLISQSGDWIKVKTRLGDRFINLGEYKKIAYLTFDDGPNQNTPQILDILKNKDAKATFFMIEPNVRNQKQIVNRIIAEGHSPGLHSVTHDKKKLYDGSPSNVAKEMETARKTVLNVSGFDSYLTRVPYGSKPYMKQSFRDAMVQRKFKMWDWSIDSNDWKYNTSSYNKILDEVKKQLVNAEKNNKPIIILMHDRAQTVKALPSIIDYLHGKGYYLDSYNPEKHIVHNFWKDNRL